MKTLRSTSWQFAVLLTVATVVRTPQMPAAAPGAASRQEVLKQYDFDEYGRQPISFYYCQAGFPPDGFKPIYVWTRDEFSQGRAVLRNLSTGASVSVPLASRGINIWGRQDWVADVSHVTEEGDYTLRVEFNGQSAETERFPIRKSCYGDLREQAAKHYFLKRCGIFCHPHDGYLRSLDADSFGKILGKVLAFGGWHDAHDDDKWSYLVWAAVYGLLKTQERFAPDWRGGNEPYPYCLAEAWWEAQWLLRMQKPDGTFYYAVTEWFPPRPPARPGQRPRVHIFAGRGENYDDLHGDRRAVLDVWGQDIDELFGYSFPNFANEGPKYFAYLAHILRYCGRLMRPYDAKNAEQCVRGARRTVAYLENLKDYPPYQELEVNAGLALYWLEDAKDGGGQASLAKSEDYLQKVLARQQPEGHFHSSATCRALEPYPEEAAKERVFLDYPFGYMLAPIEYLEYARQQKSGTFTMVDPAKTACLRFARMLEKFSHGTVFEQPGEIRFDRQPAVILPFGPQAAVDGYNPYILAAGVVFSAAENVAGYSGGRELGQRQLQWVLGANPRFMSFMNQVGVRNTGQYAAATSLTSQYYTSAFYRHLRDMRWGVTAGMYGSHDGQPPNYPNAGESIHGRYDWRAQETWLNSTGWLLLLLAQLES